VNLRLEVVSAQSPVSLVVPRKEFGAQGGTIGRASDCDWVFDKPYVSRHHANVRFLDRAFYIESNSADGVALNSRNTLIPRGERRPLKEGDRASRTRSCATRSSD
jgi:type VI secretion system protein ImpI